MGMFGRAIHSPRALGASCAIAATSLGLAYLIAAGAPMSYLAINAGALVIGLAVLLPAGRNWPDLLTLAMALTLLVTAMFGDQAEGAARWLRAGPITVQPSLIFVPAMAVAFARSRTPTATVALIVAAIALAIQPDRAMAGLLAAGLTALFVLGRDRRVLLAALAASLGFVAALLQPDNLPAMPYVDGVLHSAHQVHLLAGLAVLGGSILLLVPALLRGLRDPAHRKAHTVFGTVWLCAITAAAFGNYPTPVVGYGGSAILGYLLSVAVLPGAAVTVRGVARPIDATAPESSDEVPAHLGIAAV